MPVATGPATPSQSARPGLDSPPPLPPKLSGPDPTTLAGGQSQQQGAPPTGDLASMVAQQAMLAEKVITSIAQMLPGFNPIAAQIIAGLRQGVVGALQQATGNGGQAAPPAAAGGAAPPPGGAPPMAGGAQ